MSEAKNRGTSEATPVQVLERMAEGLRFRASSILDDSDRADGEAANDEVERLEAEADIVEMCANAIRGRGTNSAKSDGSVDSPNFVPKASTDLVARGFERVNDPRSTSAMVDPGPLCERCLGTGKATPVADGPFEGCLLETERSQALGGFRRIAAMVEHDSPVYIIAAEAASSLAFEQRRSPSDAPPAVGDLVRIARDGLWPAMPGGTFALVTGIDGDAVQLEIGGWGDAFVTSAKNVEIVRTADRSTDYTSVAAELAELKEVVTRLWNESFNSSDGALWDRLKSLTEGETAPKRGNGT